MWLQSFSQSLFMSQSTLKNIRCLSNKSAYFGKIKRKLYMRMYPTLLVQPDGSTYTIRYYEPRKIITLPIDLSQLTEEEKAIVLENRKPKKKVVIEEEIQDSYNERNYLKYFKKRQ